VTLTLSEGDVAAIVFYLVDRHGLSPNLLNLRPVHDPAQDKLNRSDPRAFCYVKPRDPHIYCARAIEQLSQCFRYGVLLHEIGHHAMQAFHGDMSEPTVDAFILLTVPESDYEYADTDYYQDGRLVRAPSLQRVGTFWPAHVRSLMGEPSRG